MPDGLRRWAGIVLAALGMALAAIVLASTRAEAIPVFARQYGISCQTCHVAFPRLNAFGERFAGEMNFRLPNWREANTVDTGDERLVLPATPPTAFRVQGYVQQRAAESIDPETGETEADAKTDFQSPYLIKLLSSAPLSEHLTYYFYGIFAEKGGNGETLIEDAWFRHDDVLGSGTAMQLGQFQISDLMFRRETRLTFQDYIPYRLAGITYDRGVLFDRGFGPVGLALGAVNGNGITDNFDVDSPGNRRPDNMFDNNTGKSVFGRIGLDAGPIGIGLMGLSGFQSAVDPGQTESSAPGAQPAGLVDAERSSQKRVYGLDLSGDIAGEVYWFAQYLQNRWDDFLEPGKAYEWTGGFAGIDWIPGDRWAYSLLYNYADAGDLDDTGTVYEGIELNSLTLGASYYFMRNAKAVVEVNYDFLEADDDADFVGHETREHYLVLGFDAAY